MKTLRRYLRRYLYQAQRARRGRPWAYMAAHVAGDHRRVRDVGLAILEPAT